jgi:OOP family OmpA-OmpF porin
MNKKMNFILGVACLLSTLVVTEAFAFRIVTKEMMETETVTKTDLIRNVDNFIVLFDTSGSSNELVPGKSVTRIAATKNLLKERNAWLPDLGYQAGLYEYTNNETLAGTFKEVYPMQPYDRDRFAAAIDQLPEKGQGPTMLQAGLHGLRKVVANLSGKTAVVMFTDGSFSMVRGPKKPLQIAQEIVEDKDVCFYLISSATDDVNRQLLEAVGKVNACSRVVPLATFLDNPNYLGGALFTVKTTSYDRLVPTTQVVGAVAENTLFDFNSSDIRPEFKSNLDQIGSYLQSNPDAYAVAAGFADSVGEEEYNLALSEHRAQSVKSYLMDTHGISPDRIVTLWFGELNPVADNATASGRALNRRVEVAVGTGNAM